MRHDGFIYGDVIMKLLTRKKCKPPSKKEKGGGNPTGLSPRNRKACHSINSALVQSVAMIRTQSTMKIYRKALHEFSPHIPPKPSKGNISRSTNKMLHADNEIK
jgi:hypothetical protein